MTLQDALPTTDNEGGLLQALPDEILVVAQDAQRALRMETVLDFLGCRPQVMSPQEYNGQWLEPVQTDWLAILFSGCAVPHAATLLERWSGLEASPPVILAGAAEEFAALPDEMRSRVVGRLDFPLRYPTLSGSLQTARHLVVNGMTPDKVPHLALYRSLVGYHRTMQRIRELIQQVAMSDANVLILGETGTGKEVVARNVHQCSTRRGKPFVAVNCGAIPGELLESELFGHEKGAFTGAISARPGRFELAQGGTLFLDEIGDMPLPMQVKILRVLQERTFERVGSTKTLTTDARIIAATHRDLEVAIREGTFREDLYYRLNVFPIEVPSLRERMRDLPLLIDELVSRMEAEGRSGVRFSPAALRVLSRYEWPGNVRELANLVERLSIMYPGESVSADDLPGKFRAGLTEQDLQAMSAADGMDPMTAEAGLPDSGLDLKEYINDLETRLIRQALDRSGGVVAHAAKLLGMRRTTLVEKMRKYGVQRDDEATES
ncbi:sigma-54 dependent transcriptional regulator [Ectothiorhodospira lacustris]|uniref:sigma-54 dependent transcriptional regulator n=2 Tax=Ectothiorhodospira lacustris TaxID=2899127 RepID=UPI002106D090|nr:sigma-54 dependent transcriptional regulator [Ectothiorhodospira lacustris]